MSETLKFQEETYRTQRQPDVQRQTLVSKIGQTEVYPPIKDTSSVDKTKTGLVSKIGGNGRRVEVAPQSNQQIREKNL